MLLLTFGFCVYVVFNQSQTSNMDMWIFNVKPLCVYQCDNNVTISALLVFDFSLPIGPLHRHGLGGAPAGGAQHRGGRRQRWDPRGMATPW